MKGPFFILLNRTVWAAALAFVCLATVACQHARVKFPDNTRIPECIKPEGPILEAQFNRGCEDAKVARTARRKAQERKTTELKQNFILWGFYPRYLYNISPYCPDGVAEIYNYSTWLDELLTEATLAFYTPRTLRITCY